MKYHLFLLASLCFLFTYDAHSRSGGGHGNFKKTIRCDYCNSTQDYQEMAELTMIAGPTGTWDVTIVNTVKQDIWVARVEVTGNYGGFFELGSTNALVISVNRESQTLIDEFKVIHEILMKDIVIDLNDIDPDTRTTILETCGTAAAAPTCAVLNTYLRNLPETQAYAISSVSRGLWRAIFGPKNLEFFVIFPDGSAIELEFVSEVQVSLSFQPDMDTLVLPNGNGVGDNSEWEDYASGGAFYGESGWSGGNDSSCDWWVFIARREDGSIVSIKFECY